MLVFFVLFIFNVFMCLIAVAFVTLLERKILGYMQFRLGPNKLSFMGFLQPFADAVKLYNKEKNWPFISNFLPFVISPLISLMTALFLWICFPFFNPVLFLSISVLMFFAILSMGVYPILIAGWSSNSNYSLIGGMRSLAQTISYEVSLVFIFMSILFFSCSLSILKLAVLQKFTMFFLFIFNFISWLISVIAELNRTPFDFAEGESELVSGFNTEYSSGTFAMIFMAEYLMILFFSMLTSFLYFKTEIYSFLFLFFSASMMFFLIWTRATLPRFRYDKLMNLCWKFLLPISLFFLYVSAFIIIFMF